MEITATVLDDWQHTVQQIHLFRQIWQRKQTKKQAWNRFRKRFPGPIQTFRTHTKFLKIRKSILLMMIAIEMNLVWVAIMECGTWKYRTAWLFTEKRLRKFQQLPDVNRKKNPKAENRIPTNARRSFDEKLSTTNKFAKSGNHVLSSHEPWKIEAKKID